MSIILKFFVSDLNKIWANYINKKLNVIFEVNYFKKSIYLNRDRLKYGTVSMEHGICNELREKSKKYRFYFFHGALV